MSKERLRIPAVGEHLRLMGTLVEIQDATPPPPERVLDYVFETVTARVELLANSRLIDTRETFNDFYGAAEESAIEQAKAYATAYGPGVEVRVVRTVHRFRARPLDSSDLYNPGFPRFEANNHYDREGLPDDVETVAWSSEEGGAR